MLFGIYTIKSLEIDMVLLITRMITFIISLIRIYLHGVVLVVGLCIMLSGCHVRGCVTGLTVPLNL